MLHFVKHSRTPWLTAAIQIRRKPCASAWAYNRTAVFSSSSKMWLLAPMLARSRTRVSANAFSYNTEEAFFS